MLPDASLTQLSVTRVMAKGGLDGLDITQALTQCTDNAQTECTALDHEQPVRCARTRPFPHKHLSEANHFCLSCYVRSGSSSTLELSTLGCTVLVYSSCHRLHHLLPTHLLHSLLLALLQVRAVVSKSMRGGRHSTT